MAPTVDTGVFKHEPLPHASTYIRLLKISSVDQTRNIPVHCELTTWLKTAAPAYTAISYTWGDPNSLAIILVNSKRMQVRCNCEDVLMQACWKKGGYFWVDAICINQVDNDEKSIQVASMGDVYKDARQVLACVGRHGNDNDSEYLFKFLHRYRHWWKRFGRSAISHVHFRFWRMLKRKSTQERLENAVNMFFSISYFQRAWIYQELFFGSDIQLCWGNHIVDMSFLWALYMAIGTCLQSPVMPGVEPSKKSVRTAVYWFQGNPNEGAKILLRMATMDKRKIFLSKMLPALRQLQCEDPRDRVFGTLAMIHWEGEKPIQPDYSKDPFDLAVEILQRARGMDDGILSEAITVAYLMGLPENPSSRLADEILARQLENTTAPRVDTSGKDKTLMEFLGFRISFHDASWHIHLHPSKDAVDGSKLEVGSPGNQSNDSRSATVQKWSKGTLWDVQRPDVLLPEETQPRDWLLVPHLHETYLGVQEPPSPVALIARDNCDGQPQLVGKALLAECHDWVLESFQNDRENKFGVYLDYEDRIVLAHSCNWRLSEKPFLSNENELHKRQLDKYFETRLCSERSQSYVAPMESFYDWDSS